MFAARPSMLQRCNIAAPPPSLTPPTINSKERKAKAVFCQQKQNKRNQRVGVNDEKIE